jgi:two-component system chemotaxis sensor kinase CheA
MDELLDDFLTETGESLAALDTALVRLEQAPDDAETLARIFRLVHTIKGTCGFMGLPRLERVAHAAETVLGRVRDGELAVGADLVSVVLAALDRIRAIVAGIAATRAEPEGDDTALIAALEQAAEGGTPRPALPAADAPAAPPQAEAAVVVGTQTIRVAVDVLESLMTLVGELVLTRNQLLQIARAQGGTEALTPLAGPLQRLSQITADLQDGVMKTRMQPVGHAWSALPRLVRDLARDLGKRVELDLHGAETELDRQVLELIKDPLTHMVRNCADHGLEPPEERRRAGKPEVGRIALRAFHEGGHIVLTIGDDGRGLPTERIRAKALALGLGSEAALAEMDARAVQRFIFHPGFSTASQVTAVSGRGVGMDVVKTNIERIGGTVELDSVEGRHTRFTIKIPLTLAIVPALIVQAGGMRFALPQIGVVELVRARNAGEAEGEATQAGAVMTRVGGVPLLRLRERLLPLADLAGLLRLTPDRDDAADTSDASTVVVVRVGADLLGIVVERAFDTEEIVVKPVAPILRDLTMFSGNTILGDGAVIMILDPNAIARAVGMGRGAASVQGETATAEEAGARAARRTTMLLFRAAEDALMAVPLAHVARLERLDPARIERSGGAPVTQYRGRLLPLVPLADMQAEAGDGTQPMLVIGEGAAAVGLLVREIVDVVEQEVRIERAGLRPGLLGSAVIAGRAADVIETEHFLARSAA